MGEEDFFSHLLKVVGNVFEAYTTLLFLKGEDGNYYLTSYFSLGDNVIKGCSIPPGKGLVGWILKNKRPLLVSDFSRETRCLCYYEESGRDKIKSFMGCPIKGEMGVLCVDTKKSYTFTPRHEKILHQFAELIGEYLLERKDIDILREQERYYKALSIISSLKRTHRTWDSYLYNLLRVISSYTGFTHCLFVARNKRGTGYYVEKSNERLKGLEELKGESFNINDGLVGWVFKNHREIMVSGSEGDMPVSSLFGKLYMGRFSAIICLPIIVNRKTRGVLVLLDPRPLQISEGLKEFLSLVNRYISMFLEVLYFKNKLKRKRFKKNNNTREGDVF